MTDKLDELATILGIARAELPAVFCFGKPKVLKVGIHEDLLARYPAADAPRLSQWLKAWTSTPDYLKRTASRWRKNRHDLDGEHAGEISEGSKWRARQLLGALKQVQEVSALSAKQEAA